MSLITDWKKVVKKSWSVRLIAAAFLLSGAETVIQLYGVDWIPIPKWARMALIMFVMGSAFIARLMAQKNLSNDQ